MNHARLRRLLPVAAVAATLALLGWILAATGISTRSAPLELEREPESAAPREAETPPIEQAPSIPADAVDPGAVPDWMSAVGAALVLLGYGVVLAVVALLVYLVARRLRRPPEGWDLVDERASTQPEPEPEKLREAVLAGLADIEAGGEPRRTVIECWLRLERAAAEVGMPRLSSETPGDLTRRVLEAARVDEIAATGLLEAYRRARYSPEEVDAQLARNAAEALRAMDAGLRAAVVRAEERR